MDVFNIFLYAYDDDWRVVDFVLELYINNNMPLSKMT